MKLTEITGLLNIDVGAPTPTIISNDSNLYLMFYSNADSIVNDPSQASSSVNNRRIYVLKFNLFFNYKFGMPGNEIIIGHPYSELGLQPYSFYQLEESDWIKDLMKIDSFHPYYNKEKWIDFKHYILTFHDNMFECIAKDFEISEGTTSIYEQASTIINEINADMR
ncbi:hypothetical protein EYV94_27850 [Puteibacter caeruleilacunae]|nr:hypothetical protein EYV94_27850 [Puteibacter caeruleilacunae]